MSASADTRQPNPNGSNQARAGIWAALLARLDAVRQISHAFGYGVGEDMDSLLKAHGGYG